MSPPLRVPELHPLSLGPAIIQFLIPQRRPFLMVDRLLGLSLDPPCLHSCRFISANDPVFGGHFPSVAIQPGALTLEGMAQTAGALQVLVGLHQALQGDLERLVGELQNLELGACLRPEYDEEREATFRRLVATAGRRAGLAGSVQVKFHQPVFPGCRLDYRVCINRTLGDLTHHSMEALVGQQRVASGTLTSKSLR